MSVKSHIVAPTVLFLAAIMCLILALACYVSYRKDISHLRSIVQKNILADHSDRLLESINHWVYANKGFKKNQDYFLLKSLGPTPIDVLKEGGDCTDKSVLLSAMLESIGIDSTLVMLFDIDGTTPTHTVVEVRNRQFEAAADPVYDLVFPKPHGGYYAINDLRNNPSLLVSRLDFLIQERGSSDKIALYKRTSESYNFASTINWNKNYVLSLFSDILGNIGIDARNIRRPRFLDDPKLFVTVTLTVTGSFLIFLALVLKTMLGTTPRNPK